MDELFAQSARMAQAGIRRLLVVSGEATWCVRQATAFRHAANADVLWVGPTSMDAPFCLPSKFTTLLGREFQHAVFDARNGFDVSAFAALAGTLRAGSWLLLLVPEWESWHLQTDADSVRWSDASEPIATPHFVEHFRRMVTASAQTLVWRQGQPLPLQADTLRTDWQRANGQPEREQQAILQVLSNTSAKVCVVTAERGRGKSALAGMHIQQLQGDAIVTAPSRASTDVIAVFAGERFCFMAPDALLASDAVADWLVVDEAAAIPAPLLKKLIARFPHTLLTTTVQGYEGTGRGFLLKFCAEFPQREAFTLMQPIRWAAGCPLEAVINDALIFHDDAFSVCPEGALALQAVEQSSWQSQPEQPAALYQLLSGAHYRTSPLDLRRMMDAPGQHFLVAQTANGPAGALWLVDEGGLTPELSQAVWAGFRRPRGNLVAQSLAAHGGSPLAATLIGRRISRIAVHPLRQREGIGQQLVAKAWEEADSCDYLSVSFGFTDELWRFWQRCGFTLVRIGTQREASSGCYAAMALRPITVAGEALMQREHARLCREWRWLQRWIDEKIPLPDLPTAILNDDDWWDLAGFAFAHRPLLAVLANLNHLVELAALPLPALRGRLNGDSEAELCSRLGINGRKSLLLRLRDEAQQAMRRVNGERTNQLMEQIRQLQFF
ncbi:tRNA(Met) cytidine acetyltransferase TmcA [Kluyvera genomosp. 1]|uniref:tRNA(Met) cytidine acetyltransferase TmcA n=1 Tax=Kluyvera genomosp. 1 TaxID=2774053 RepID=UPI0009E1A896|nr:GNAT family N-acetyltransferase [Kluyvera genomosp. 1]